MCGIAGILHFATQEPVSREQIRSMTATMAHRGPDDEGFLVDRELAIGHRRLSIIDLAEGHQPLHGEDDSVWVAFNGEIYNFEDLRTQLMAKGHRFTTRTDTEVLVHAYEEHGTQLVDELRGMFAFGVWDARRRRLLLARDRFGKKPLYVAEAPGKMAFASEMKALLQLSWVDRTWDARGLQGYLDCGYIPGAFTAYRGIRKMLPGTIEVWNGAGQAPSGLAERHSYWEPGPVPADPLPTYDEACGELAERLCECVRIRLRSDVPLGAFLSGGLDSTCIVAVMRMCGVNDLKTFSIGFDTEARSDLPFADEAARMLATDHHSLVHSAADPELVSQVIDLFDEPYADSSAIPMLLVSRLAREHVTVALSGDGGDELFAGYSQYLRFDRYRKIDRVPMPLQAAARAVGTRFIPRGARGGRFVRMLGVPAHERFGTRTRGPRLALLRGALGKPCLNFLDEVGDMAWSESEHPPTSVSDLQLRDQRDYLADDILAKVDRCSMAVSLEARAPLLDHTLAEWVNSLPTDYKLRNGETKALLRDTVRRHLPKVPDGVLSRGKKGFGIPLHTLWGPLAPLAHERFAAAPAGLLDEVGMRRLLDGDPMNRDNGVALWMILNMASWAGQHRQTPW